MKKTILLKDKLFHHTSKYICIALVLTILMNRAIYNTIFGGNDCLIVFAGPEQPLAVRNHIGGTWIGLPAWLQPRSHQRPANRK